jgi:hypothetical protein
MKLNNQHISYRTIVRLLLEDPFKSWSIESAEILADYYTEQENEWGMEFTFDRVTIRCEWMEFENLKEVRKVYPYPKGIKLNNTEYLKYLEDETTLFKLASGGFLILNF